MPRNALEQVPMSDIRLEMQGIGKQYGPNWVLRDVDLRLNAGQVLALLGENGAGKSTLVKILSGAVLPDRGQVILDGHPLAEGDPAVARRRGVAIVYQELSVCPDLSIEANVLLGVEQHRGTWLRPHLQRPRIREVFRRLGHPHVDLHQPVGLLSIGMQQLVEIARALLNEARVLVLDEPTSSLPAADAQRLFATVRRLAEDGLSVIYISHFMEEIRQLCDSYLVLRDGRVAGHGMLTHPSADSADSPTRAASDNRSIVQLMVGRDVADLYPSVPHVVGEPVLDLQGVSGERLAGPIDITIRRGEIFGIAGLVGAGRTELLRQVFALDPARSGKVMLRGQPMPATTRGRLLKGLGLVSENRKTDGLALQRSITDNITLSRLEPYHRLGWLNESRRRQAATKLMKRMQVKADDADDSVDRLSGGNQQKVALARMLHQQADVWLLDEPTRGIDVGTKAEIYRLIGELAAAGTTLVLVSSYFPELLRLCDRIAVLARGRLVAVRPAKEWNEHELMLAAMGSDLSLHAEHRSSTAD